MPGNFLSIASTIAGATGTSVTVSTPDGTVLGDTLTAVIAHGGDGADISAPGGWVEVEQGDAANTEGAVAIFELGAGNSEPADYAFTWSGSTGYIGVIMRYGNLAPSPIDVSAQAASLVAPTVTTSLDNQTGIRVGMEADDDLLTVPGGETQRFQGATSGLGMNSVSLSISEFIQATAGATGTGTFTGGSSSGDFSATVSFTDLVPAIVSAGGTAAMFL